MNKIELEMWREELQKKSDSGINVADDFRKLVTEEQKLNEKEEDIEKAKLDLVKGDRQKALSGLRKIRIELIELRYQYEQSKKELTDRINFAKEEMEKRKDVYKDLLDKFTEIKSEHRQKVGNLELEKLKIRDEYLRVTDKMREIQVG